MDKKISSILLMLRECISLGIPIDILKKVRGLSMQMNHNALTYYH